MEILKLEEFIKFKNPKSDVRYSQEVISKKQKAKMFGGHFSILPPGGELPYHFHNERETIMVVISGEATELVEGKEVPLKAGEVIYIPAGEKHGIINKTNKELRYFGFTSSPGVEDNVSVNRE